MGMISPYYVTERLYRHSSPQSADMQREKKRIFGLGEVTLARVQYGFLEESFEVKLVCVFIQESFDI